MSICRLGSVLVVVLASLLAARYAQACRCLPPPAPTKAKEKAVGVFSGTVSATKVEGQTLYATVTVTQSWKGEPAKEVIVRTPSSSAACGYGFKEGKSYLIYCSGKNDAGFATNSCTRTRPLKGAKEDLEALGPTDEAE